MSIPAYLICTSIYCANRQKQSMMFVKCCILQIDLSGKKRTWNGKSDRT
mgnify:CR=1 FL=1